MFICVFYLGVSMLASFRGSHFNNLTGASFQHDKAIFPQRGALRRVGFRGSRFPTLKILIDICVHGEVCHLKRKKKFRGSIITTYKFPNNMKTHQYRPLRRLNRFWFRHFSLRKTFVKKHFVNSHHSVFFGLETCWNKWADGPHPAGPSSDPAGANKLCIITNL